MAKDKTLTPSDKVNKFLTDNGLALQIKASRPTVRYLEDGGMVIDAPQCTVGVVEIKLKKAKNGKSDLDIN